MGFGARARRTAAEAAAFPIDSNCIVPAKATVNGTFLRKFKNRTAK